MKKAISLAALFFTSILVYSQTQADVVRNFFYQSGRSVVSDCAHPTCTASLESVRHRPGTLFSQWYDVSIRYTESDYTYFICSYKVKVNSSGYLETIESDRCNSGDAGCYVACNVLRVILSALTSDEKDFLEKFFHKALSEITCEEYCLGILYYKWNAYSYRAAYVVAQTNSNEPISASIDRVWVEHNVTQDYVTGMRIHVKFSSLNMLNVRGRAIAYFYFSDGTKLKDFNNKYNTSDGQVSAGEDFTPPYTSTTYNDFVIFMPVTELHMDKGVYNLKFYVKLYEYSTPGSPNALASSDYITFQVTN